MSVEHVILVDDHDGEIGVEEKAAAHLSGKLHRAFSIFVFNSAGKLLLQKRALHKYHSGGLWSNTCCGHPRPGEDTAGAAHRRLHEEMGLACGLEKIHSFIYRTELDNGLIEHEYDHVFVGYADRRPRHDPSEVDAWKWVELNWLAKDMQRHSERYTFWLRGCLAAVIARGAG